jgi:hypothetical protein
LCLLKQLQAQSQLPVNFNFILKGPILPGKCLIQADSVARYSANDWEHLLLQRFKFPENGNVLFSRQDLLDFSISSLRSTMQEAIQGSMMLSEPSISPQSNGSHSCLNESSDLGTSRDNMGNSGESECTSFKGLLAYVLTGMEICLRLGVSGSTLQSLTHSFKMINQPILFEIIAANGCTAVFFQYLRYAQLDSYIELTWAPLVPSEDIITILKKSDLTDLHELFANAISAHRMSLIEYIITSGKLSRKQYSVTLIERVHVLYDPLMYAISVDNLRAYPHLLITQLSLFLRYGMDSAYDKTSIHAPFIIDSLFMAPCTPLELAVHYGCWEVIDFLLESMDPRQLCKQASQAIFFAQSMHVFKSLVRHRSQCINLQVCREGVSLWASAAFTGNFEVIAYLRDTKVPYAVPNSQYPPIIAALVQPDKNFNSIYQMVEFLIVNCGLNVDDTVTRSDLLKNRVTLGFYANYLDLSYALTALDVAETLASHFPAAKDVAELIKAHGGQDSEIIFFWYKL